MYINLVETNGSDILRNTIGAVFDMKNLQLFSSVQFIKVRHKKNINTLESCFIVESEVAVLIKSSTDIV